MMSMELDMEEIFDEGHADDTDLGAAGGTSPQHDGNDGEHIAETQGEVPDDVLDRLKDISGAAKKKVMRPQPKLNAERLRGERGLPALPKLFKDFKFKGKGHEAEELKKIMRTLEHWAHRLFPKITFDEFIARMERMGSKKDVQNIVQRLRMDMPVLDSEYVTQYADDAADEEPQPGPSHGLDPWDAEEEFDALIRQERELQIDQACSDNLFNMDVSSTTTSASHAAATDETSAEKKVITSEARERMERNKQLAMEKRLKRLGLSSAGSTPATPANESTCTAAIHRPPSSAEGPLDTPSNSASTVLSRISREETLRCEQTEPVLSGSSLRQPMDSENSEVVENRGHMSMNNQYNESSADRVGRHPTEVMAGDTLDSLDQPFDSLDQPFDSLDQPFDSLDQPEDLHLLDIPGGEIDGVHHISETNNKCREFVRHQCSETSAGFHLHLTESEMVHDLHLTESEMVHEDIDETSRKPEHLHLTETLGTVFENAHQLNESSSDLDLHITEIDNTNISGTSQKPEQNCVTEKCSMDIETTHNLAYTENSHSKMPCNQYDNSADLALHLTETAYEDIRGISENPEDLRLTEELGTIIKISHQLSGAENDGSVFSTPLADITSRDNTQVAGVPDGQDMQLKLSVSDSDSMRGEASMDESMSV